jgi:hypothetical protein
MVARLGSRNPEAFMAPHTPASTIWLFIPFGLPVEPDLIGAVLASAIALSATITPGSDDRVAVHEPVIPDHGE